MTWDTGHRPILLDAGHRPILLDAGHRPILLDAGHRPIWVGFWWVWGGEDSSFTSYICWFNSCSCLPIVAVAVAVAVGAAVAVSQVDAADEAERHGVNYQEETFYT